MLLSHQFGEHGLDDNERQHLAAALAIAERAMTTAAAAGLAPPILPGTTPPGAVGSVGPLAGRVS
jgi:hypothetical protein